MKPVASCFFLLILLPASVVDTAAMESDGMTIPTTITAKLWFKMTHLRNVSHFLAYVIKLVYCIATEKVRGWGGEGLKL